MYMICYIDIYFLENVLMNYIILFGTAKIRKIKINWVRILIASSIGAICSVMVLVISNKFSKTGKSNGITNAEQSIESLVIKIILSLVMIKVAYKVSFNKSIIKTLIVFYLISFATAGIAMSLIYSNAFTIVKFADNPENITRKMSQQSIMKNAILSGTIGFIITLLAFKYNKSKIKKDDLICELIIKIGNKKVSLKALIDTGNSLKYSNTNDNVIIVEKDKVFSEDEFKKYIYGGGDANTRLRLIPFKSIGKEDGVLIGIKPDEVIMIKDENKINVENVIIGMYGKKIGTKYSAIIGIN